MRKRSLSTSIQNDSSTVPAIGTSSQDHLTFVITSSISEEHHASKQTLHSHKCVGSQIQELPMWNLKLAPYTKGKDRLKIKGTDQDYSRLVCDRFKKKGKVQYLKVCLGHLTIGRSLYPLARILTVYTEAFTGFSHVYHPDGLTTHCSLNNTTSLKTAPTAGTVGGMYIQRTRNGVRSPYCPGPAPGSTGSHVFSMSFCNKMPNEYLKMCYPSFGQTIRIQYFSAASKFRAKFNIIFQ